MGLAPELESRLQAAHLEALVPVLARLGVEASTDLELVQESDLENQESITILQKRKFYIWKKKTLEEQSQSGPTNETEQEQSNPQKTSTCPQSTKLSPVSKAEALHPYGSQPRDPALDLDFHKIFDDPSLSADDVKSLYHDLCKRHHPDKGGNAEVFARITKAYNACVIQLESSLATAPAIIYGADKLLEKSGSMYMDSPFVPKRRGFRASLKLCCASIVHMAK